MRSDDEERDAVQNDGALRFWALQVTRRYEYRRKDTRRQGAAVRGAPPLAGESGRPPARVTIRSKVRADGTQYAERYAAKRRFFQCVLV